MVTFLFILGGLIAVNFILLKFSIQSIDTPKKGNPKVIDTTEVSTSNLTTSKTKEVKDAA